MNSIATTEKRVKVSFNFEMSFTDLIEAGNYNSVESNNITQENFPLDAESRYEEEIFILAFGRRVTSDEVIVEMNKLGLRPSTSTHALTFGAQYPEEQEKNPIVFLGSLWVTNGDRYAPCLYKLNNKRALFLTCFEYSWFTGYRFAAVHE